MSTPKSVHIVCSPKTYNEIEVTKISDVFAPDDEIYCLPNGMKFSRTEAQSQARIVELEALVEKLEAQLEYWSYVPNY
jgi:hypothetical protein